MTTIELARPDTEGGGCYGCKLSRVCSARRAMEKAVIQDHLDFFNVDERPPKWQWLIMVLAEACTRYEPLEDSA